MKVSGDHCKFIDCVIGNHTINRSVANAQIEFTDGADDIIFDDCTIKSLADNAGALFVTAVGAAGDVATTVQFNRCKFLNIGTTMTEALAIHATLTGTIYLDSCVLGTGCTDWEAAAESGKVEGVGPAVGSATVGLAVAVTAA